MWPLLEWLVDPSGRVPHLHGTQHINRFDHRSLVALMQQHGFDVRRQGHFCTIAPFGALIGRRIADAAFKLELAVDLPFGDLLWLVARSP